MIPIGCRIPWIPQLDLRLSFFDWLVSGEPSLIHYVDLFYSYWILRLFVFVFLNDITEHSEHGV